MKVDIEVDTYLIEKMFDKYCPKHDCCANCPSSVLIDEPYDGCYGKYEELFFKNDFQDLINNFLDLCDKVN